MRLYPRKQTEWHAVCRRHQRRRPPRLGAQTGSVGGFTARYAVHQLVYAEQHASMEDAIPREKQIEKWRRAWKIELIERANPTWRDLYDPQSL